MAHRPCHLYPLPYTGGLLNAIGLKTSANADTTSNLLTDIHWQPFGAADSWNWQMAGGAQAYSRSYDGYGRIVRYPLGSLVRDITCDAGDRIQKYTHYDAATAQAQPSYDQSFDYDELGRLKGISTNVNTWGIQYDANGNRTGFTLNGTAQTYNVDVTSNKLLNIDQSRSFNYDNAGNTKTDSTSYSATYGITGMLASITKAGITTSYSYNNNGQRIRKTDGTTAGTTVYVYDFNTGNLLGEYDANGNPVKEYVWMGDTPVAVLTPDPVNSANPPLVYYVYSDHLNTPRVIVDQNNAIRWRWLAEPFGNTAPESNPSNLGAFSFNLRFPGQYADQESGLYYNINRYYDPSVGRYQQSDPIGLAGGSWSTYNYVNGNPLLYYDPNGLWALSGGFNIGPGLQLTFGRDYLTNRGFFDVKVGWGLGVTAKFSPNGGLPHSVVADCGRGGFSVRSFLEVGKFSAGPIDAKLIDAKAGYNLNINNFGRLDFLAQRFVKYNPKSQLQAKTWGLSAKAGSLGLGVTMYTGSSDCTCGSRANNSNEPAQVDSPPVTPMHPWTQADFLYGYRP